MTSVIWSVPAYLPYLQPPLVAAAVAQVEEQLGVSLPESYLALLAQQNGGYVRLTLPDSVHGLIWGIGPHFPNIGMDHWWKEQADGGGDQWLPADPALLVPFDGDGHWHLCFDYRERGPHAEPAVGYIDLESEHEEEIAGSFTEFLAMLRPSIEDNTFGISGAASIEAAVQRFSAALGVKFDMAGSDNSGYPIYRWPLGDGQHREWAWLAPNQVPRGFVRTSDERHAQLSGLLPGTALRFPEYPDMRFIVTCTYGVAGRVRTALEAGFPFGHGVIGL